MRITAWGAERNHGTSELLDRSLDGIRTFTVETAGSGNEEPLGITITAQTRIVMNGNYYLKTTFSTEEIAKLFYYTHREEILGLSDVFYKFKNSEETEKPVRKSRR